MTANKLYEKVKEHQKNIDYGLIYSQLGLMNSGAWKDVLGDTPYYKWLSALVDYIKPSQIVELGGAMGVACLMILPILPKKSHLYSITLEENGLEFSFIPEAKKHWSNFHFIIGNDLDLLNWPKNLDHTKTDVLFIDTLHEGEQLRKEIELYSPFFKKGMILLLDDINLNPSMRRVWDELKYDKFESLLHWSGYGIAVV